VNKESPNLILLLTCPEMKGGPVADFWGILLIAVEIRWHGVIDGWKGEHMLALLLALFYFTVADTCRF
jgi:hypothetical protein